MKIFHCYLVKLNPLIINWVFVSQNLLRWHLFFEIKQLLLTKTLTIRGGDLDQMDEFFVQCCEAIEKCCKA